MCPLFSSIHPPCDVGGTRANSHRWLRCNTYLQCVTGQSCHGAAEGEYPDEKRLNRREPTSGLRPRRSGLATRSAQSEAHRVALVCWTELWWRRWNKKGGMQGNRGGGGFTSFSLWLRKKANSCFTLMLDINTEMMFSIRGQRSVFVGKHRQPKCN